VAGASFVLGNAEAAADGSLATPTKATIKGTMKGAKGGKKGQKQQPYRVAIVADNRNDDEGAGDSSEKFIAATKCNLKCQTWPPEDHFEKLLKATCLHHS
jgi:hypothetical protein